MGKILQFPLKQNAVTQVLLPDGTLNYIYVVDFIREGKQESFHIWAADDADAAEKLYYISLGAQVRCRLSEFIQPQGATSAPVISTAADAVMDENHQPYS